jgi:hypothetical protein
VSQYRSRWLALSLADLRFAETNHIRALLCHCTFTVHCNSCLSRKSTVIVENLFKVHIFRPTESRPSHPVKLLDGLTCLPSVNASCFLSSFRKSLAYVEFDQLVLITIFALDSHNA